MKDKQQLIGEIRYAIRLAERTARLYRRIQTTGVFLSIIGGSAAMTSIANGIPAWITATGGILLTFAGATLIAVRPADKAAQNEADAKRYQQLMTHANSLNEQALEDALEETRIGSASEIEPLRAIAYNDMVLEINRPDAMIELSSTQKILRSLA